MYETRVFGGRITILGYVIPPEYSWYRTLRTSTFIEIYIKILGLYHNSHYYIIKKPIKEIKKLGAIFKKEPPIIKKSNTVKKIF